MPDGPGEILARNGVVTRREPYPEVALLIGLESRHHLLALLDDKDHIG
jgi:hypothetical protein